MTEQCRVFLDGCDPSPFVREKTELPKVTQEEALSIRIEARPSRSICGPGNSSPDFSVTAASAGGSLPGVPGAVYDTCTVALLVNGTQIASTSYGAGSTAASVASALASAGSGNSLVTLTANGANLGLTAKGDGTITDYSYQFNVTYNTGTFGQPPSRGRRARSWAAPTFHSIIGPSPATHPTATCWR